MEEVPPVLDSPPAPPPPPAMSLAARLLNVFAIPVEVFEVVKVSRISVGNWILPMLLSAVVLAVTGVTLEPAFEKQKEEALNQWAKALNRGVSEGKLKQKDADTEVAFWRAVVSAPVVKLLIVGVAPVVGVARVLWWAFLLWLIGLLFLKVRFSYFKALEVSGLALMIRVLGDFVLLLLTMNVPQLFTAPGLWLTSSSLALPRESTLLAVTDTVFSFWLIGVLSLGLARLTRVPLLRASWFVLVLWLIQQSVPLLIAGLAAPLAR
jgi:hypothetical protein